MIELQTLCAGYRGQPVLQAIDLAFPAGAVTVLLGPNGCGKTTLLKTALGLIPALGGQVLYDGAPLQSLTPAQTARLAAYLPQNRPVPNIQARRMVLHGRFPYLAFPRHYRKTDYEIVDSALDEADARALADRPMPELSGGQRQKIYLAMALAQQAGTVFMDEPTTWLDARHQLEVMHTARALAERGRAVCLVSHDLCLALRAADRVALLADGGLKFCGTPERLYESGLLDEVFGVAMHRVQGGDGWRYYFD